MVSLGATLGHRNRRYSDFRGSSLHPTSCRTSRQVGFSLHRSPWPANGESHTAQSISLEGGLVDVGRPSVAEPPPGTRSPRRPQREVRTTLAEPHRGFEDCRAASAEGPSTYHRDLFIRSPHPCLRHAGVVHPLDSHARTLAASGSVGPPHYLPLAGRVRHAVTDLKLHRKKTCRARWIGRRHRGQRRLYRLGLLALPLAARPSHPESRTESSASRSGWVRRSFEALVPLD